MMIEMAAKSRQILIAFVYAVMLVLVGLSIGFGSYWIPAAVTLVAFVLVSLVHRMVAIVTTIIAAVTSEWLVSLVPGAPHALVLARDVTVLVLLICAAGAVLERRRVVMPVFGWFVLALGAVAIVSAAVGGQSWLVTAAGLRTYLKYPLMAAALVQFPLSQRQTVSILKVLGGLLLLQVPVAIGQFVHVGGSNPDTVTGTLGFGMSGVLSLLLLIGVAALLAWSVGGAGRYAVLLAAGAYLVIPIALNETKVSFFIGPALLGTVLLQSSRVSQIRSRYTRMALTATLVIVMLGGLLLSYESLYRTTFLSQDYVSQYLGMQFESGGRLNRLPAAAFAVDKIRASGSTLIFGLGPGAASDSEVPGASGSLALLYPTWKLDDTFFSRFTLEFGVLGWMVLVAWLVHLQSWSRTVMRRRLPPLWLGITVVLAPAAVMLTLLSIYNGTLANDTLACVLWALVALVQLESSRDDAAPAAVAG